MKLIKDEQLAKLFDLYKNILSDTQRKFLTDFIDSDLTITEIAENNGISRQAANDAIKKGVSKMKKLENTLGCLEKISVLEDEISKLKKEA